MTTLRKIFITALAVMAISAVASASTITIGYQTIISATPTDITNTTASLTSFNPGGSDSTVSNVSGTGYTTGISMASLDAANTTYTLTGFNISVKETLTGSYTVTDTSSSDATGSAFIDTYTAVALGGALSPALSVSTDPTNDLFNCSLTDTGAHSGSCSGSNPGEQPTSVGGGPDPNAPSSGQFDLTTGQSFDSGPINVNSKWVDYGCEVTGQSFCNESNIASALSNELTSGLGAVEGPSGLTFDFSTLTTTDTALTGGNLTTAYSTSVQEQVEVTYTYDQETTGPTPEPGTMALMGGALLGLGLMRKRLKKS